MEVFSEPPPSVLSDGGIIGAAGISSDAELVPILPRQPRTVRDTGLELRLVTALTVKIMHASGKIPLSLLTGRLRLSVSVVREVLQGLVAEQLAEVAWCGDSDIDVHYQLTAFGQRAAAEHLAESTLTATSWSGSRCASPTPLASHPPSCRRCWRRTASTLPCVS
jgi:hypothetical protein